VDDFAHLLCSTPYAGLRIGAGVIDRPPYPLAHSGTKAGGEEGHCVAPRLADARQARQWDAREEFEVIGCDTGTHYRITRGTMMNIHELDRTGKTVAQWCFAPEGKLATGDVLLAQKIALETMEHRALRLANTQACRP
jgi:hypothetical protein